MVVADPFESSDPTSTLMRSVDWAKTSFGSIENWPESLATTMRTCMASRFPMAILWGSDLGLVYNDACRRMMGAKHPSAIGRPCYEVFHELVETIKPMLDGVLKTGKATWSDDLLLPTERHGYREEAYFTLSYSAIRDDGRLVAGILVTVMETTERVLAHRRLHLASELARRATHATDVEEACRQAASVFEDFAGDIAAAAIYLVEGQEARIVATAHVDSAQMPSRIDLAGPSLIAEAVRTGLPRECEARLVLPSRPDVRDAILVPIERVGQGRPSAVLVAGVNPQRTIDNAYRDFVSFAACQLGSGMTYAMAWAEIANARAEAERANAVKDEFLAMLGHELRNPLAPILTAIELIKIRGEAAMDREHVIIDRQVRHLVRLLDDLLDVSRITRGKIVLRRTDVDLADAVADGIETARPLVEERTQVLDLTLPRGRLFVHGDRDRLAQVVSNLVTNAAKFTATGGRIDISAVRDGSDVVLRVCDTGVGMTPDLLARVFGLFEQGNRTIDRAAGGLGLGLALVKSITSMHDGSVTAMSRGVGFGSEFVVRLPAIPEDREAMVSAPREGKLPSGSRVVRVLIVDDNEDGADLLDVALQSLGHETRVAHDGPEALEAAEAFEPEVALVDIGLPVMDGYEVARRLRARFEARCPKLIAVTGYGQDSDRRRARDAGFDRHLVKPVDLSRLFELILWSTSTE